MKQRRLARVFIAVTIVGTGTLAWSMPADALVITPGFDSSIVTAPNAADIENSINLAVGTIENLYSNPGTVSILFKYGPGTFLGQSNSGFYFDSYAAVTSELAANAAANSANTLLAAAVANFSQGNDSNASKSIVATSAFFREGLGDDTATPCFNTAGTFISSCGQIYDGVVTLSSSQPLDFTRPIAAYNGSNTAYDAVRVAEHEIDEVLGGGGSGTTLGASDSSRYFGILDLYRYSAAGTPSFSTVSTVASYFSVDGGNTKIAGFNQNSSGDFGDWSRSSPSCPGYVQDAFSCNNAEADVTQMSPEFAMLEAIGYDPSASVGTDVSWDCSINPDSSAHTGAISATKTTDCTQVVLGTNTYSGGTTISRGTLVIGSGAASGSITGDVADNAVFGIDRSDGYVFSGIISGGGSFQQMGTGATYLLGTNTYSGGTTISRGTLVIGSGAASGSITGDVADNAVFGIDRSDGYVFSGIISGGGSFQQMGTGATYLLGTNTYSGGTTISRGTLVIGSGAASGSITGDVADNAVFGIDRSDGYVFSGIISGGGSFQQMGTGATYLLGTNTYSGGTTISRGTLVIGSGAASGSITGDVADNAVFGIDRSDGYVFSGIISGGGSFQQMGTGATYLLGTNTYSGGTTISRGTLVIGSGAASGSITGDVADNAVFGIDRSDGYVFSGIISGGGSFQQMGTGATYLLGTNTYSGGTTISRGTLRLNTAYSVGSGTVSLIGPAATLLLDDNVNLSNTIDINASSFIDVVGTDTAALSGPLVGISPFEKDGTGTLILNYDNRATYSGNISYHGTLIAGVSGAFGTGMVTNLGSALQLADGVVLTNQINLVDDLTVTQNGGVGTLAGSIGQTGGPWNVTKTGAGTLVLANSNAYTGSTKVQEGMLVIVGSVAGGVIVQSGAQLAVSGIVGGGLAVQRGATVSSVPLGAGFGTLQAASYTESSSTLAVRFGGGPDNYASDRIAVSGTVSLTGGQIDARPAGPASDYTFNQRYLVVSTPNAVEGRFANPAGFTANATDPALLQRVRYDLGGVVLEIRKPIDFVAGVATLNQLAVASAIDSTELSASDSWANVVNALAALSPQGRASAFDQMSGVHIVNANQMVAKTLDAFDEALQSHFLDTSAASTGNEQLAAIGYGGHAWITGLHGSGGIGANNTSAAYLTLVNGIEVGVDGIDINGLKFGFAGGVNHPQQMAAGLTTSTTGDGSYFGSYASYDFANAFVGIRIAYAANRLKESRLIGLGEALDAAGSLEQQGMSLTMALGTRLPLLGGSFEPVAEFRYRSIAQGSLVERDGGTGVGLNIAPFSSEEITESLGARWQAMLRSGQAWFAPEIDAALTYRGANSAPTTFAHLQGAPSGTGNFMITGADSLPLFGLVGIGLAIGDDDEGVSLHLKYEGRFEAGATRHDGLLNVSYQW